MMHQDVLIAVSSAVISMPSAPTWHAVKSHDQMTSGPSAEIFSLGLYAMDNVVFSQLGPS